jgi:hypothetical protein
MFSTKGQEVKTGGGVMKSLQPGVVYAHIYSGQVRTSRNKDKKSLELVLEGPAIENFEGWAIDKQDPEGPKFRGQSARISATIWTDQFNVDDVNRNEILNKLVIIADELGLREKVNALSDQHNISSIEEWVSLVIDILKGHDLYWFLKGTEEEYNGKTIVKLSLPRYRFVSQEESKLEKFDKNNQYHYKAMEKTPVASFEPVNDDFDM